MSKPKKSEVKTAKQKQPPKQPQVVFAFRLSEVDRDAIHAAAGPGKATKFVLAAALAAAKGDTKGFEALVEQAKRK